MYYLSFLLIEVKLIYNVSTANTGFKKKQYNTHKMARTRRISLSTSVSHFRKVLQKNKNQKMGFLSHLNSSPLKTALIC